MLVVALVTVLSGLALWFPIHDFLRVLPLISGLYNQPLQPGWGMVVMVLGLVVMVGASIWCGYDQRNHSTD